MLVNNDKSVGIYSWLDTNSRWDFRSILMGWDWPSITIKWTSLMVIWGSTQIKMIRMTFSRSYLEGSRRWQWANTRSKLSRSCEKISPWQKFIPSILSRRKLYWVGMGRFGSIIKSIRERWHEGLDRKRKLSQDRSLECSRRSIPMLNKSSTNYRYNSASYHAWHRFDRARLEYRSWSYLQIVSIYGRFFHMTHTYDSTKFICYLW